MSLIEAILFGFLQGATEFLPVSSSGHLLLAQRLAGIREPELAFDLLLHLGTLAAVAFFLREEIGLMFRTIVRREGYLGRETWGRREIGLVILATIPTGIIGIAFHKVVETQITFWGVGARYLVLTALLLASNLRLRHKFDPDRIEAWEAVAIGIVQGLAVFPGLSRAGSTITIALLLGIGASRSVKFSFLISIPAILGAAVVGMRHGMSVLPPALPSAAGFLGAVVAGYLALKVVERLVVRGRFMAFAPYTLLLSALCFYLQFRG